MRLIDGLTLLALCLSGQAYAQPKPTLVVSVYGGDLGATVRRAYVGFEQKYNVTINWQPGVSGEALAKIVATRSAPAFDVAFGDDLSLYSGSQQGVWAPIDETIATHYRELVPEGRAAKNEGGAIGFFYTGLFYDKPVFQKNGWPEPKSWNDLLNQQYCGKVGFLHPNVVTSIDALLMLAGGKADAMGPAITRLADYGSKCISVLEPSPGSLEQKVQMGDYVFGAYNTIRVIPLQQRNVPIGFVLPKEGAVLSSSDVSVVKGSRNPVLAQQFVDWAFTADAQRILMQGAYYTPANPNVDVPAELQRLGVLPLSQINTLVSPPEAEILAKRRAWTAALEQQMAR